MECSITDAYGFIPATCRDSPFVVDDNSGGGFGKAKLNTLGCWVHLVLSCFIPLPSSTLIVDKSHLLFYVSQLETRTRSGCTQWSMSRLIQPVRALEA